MIPRPVAMIISLVAMASGVMVGLTYPRPQPALIPCPDSYGVPTIAEMTARTPWDDRIQDLIAKRMAEHDQCRSALARYAPGQVKAIFGDMP